MGLVKEDGTLVEQLYYNSTGLCKSWDPSGGGNWNTHPDNAAYNLGRSEYIPFGYLGMYRDRFTGKYHTHFREYDPLHARWLSEDPAGYADGLNLYNAYMGVNGIDPLGLEISKREMMEAYSDIFGYDDILLRAFIASGHSFDMGDVLGDWDVDRSWFTKGQPLDIEIEEDLDAVTAAFYLRKAFFQALGDSREMRKNVLSMKYGSNDPGAFKGSDSYFRAGEWAAELKQLEAIAAANMSVDAAAMAEAYFSIPAIMSEGADFVSTVAEVCDGNYYALAGLLPFVPSTVKMVDNFKGSVDNVVGLSRVRKVNNRLPINAKNYAGRYVPLEDLPVAIRGKYPNSVFFSKAGYPDFARYAKAQVRIEPTGQRIKDFRLANKAAGFKKTPDGFTWHHHQETGIMQLVPNDLHKNVRHTGGIAIGN